MALLIVLQMSGKRGRAECTPEELATALSPLVLIAGKSFVRYDENEDML